MPVSRVQSQWRTGCSHWRPQSQSPLHPPWHLEAPLDWTRKRPSVCFKNNNGSRKPIPYCVLSIPKGLSGASSYATLISNPSGSLFTAEETEARRAPARCSAPEQSLLDSPCLESGRLDSVPSPATNSLVDLGQIPALLGLVSEAVK